MLCKDIVYIYLTAGLVNGITYIGMVRYFCKWLPYIFHDCTRYIDCTNAY